MKVMAFGSCLSNVTIAVLIARYGFEQTHSVHHNRSDNFLMYHVRKDREIIPFEYWQDRLVYKPDNEAETRQFLLNQYSEGIGFHELREKKRPGKDFFDDMEEMDIDVILIDNFMDLAAKLVYSRLDKERGKSPIFLNAGFYENEAEIANEYWHTEYLDPRQSAINQLEIYRWLRERQPKAKIFFLPYHTCTSLGTPDRFARAREFYLEFEPLARNEDLYLIPPLELPSHLTKGEENWPHFEMVVYEALAGYIFLHAVAGLPKPAQPTTLPPLEVSASG